jgi:hypothetical protein
MDECITKNFIEMIQDHMVWYRETQIKQCEMRPLEYRQNLGLCA